MLYSKFSTKIGGKATTVVHITNEKNTASIVPVRTHHILLLDRSGSMYEVLNSLIDQVKSVVNLIPKTDLLSIIWYSGPGQYKPVVIGAKADTDINRELDTLRHTVGTTCFSESLASANELISQKSMLVDQTSITLFTDGQPVVPWGSHEEQTRSISLVRNMVNNGLSALNCVGYGPYYNREFLIKLSDATDHGVMLHNSRISEFLESFKSTSEGVTNLKKTPFDLASTNDGILYLNSDGAEHLHNVFMLHMNSLSQGTNDFFLINPQTIEEYVDTNTVKLTEISSIKAKTEQEAKMNFLYGYASRLYYYGERKKALDIIINNIKDRCLANLMINAFTNDEVGEAQKALSNAVHDTAYRFKEGKCPPAFVPKADATCVMDIFGFFFSSKEPVYYLPFSKNVDAYERIGRKVEDKQNSFTASETEVRAPLTEFIWNKDKLNLSVAFTIDGTVELNARAASANNLPIHYPAKIYRTHTFVKDGNLNIKRAEFIVPDSVVFQLGNKGVKYKTIEVSHGYHAIVLDLYKYPIINRTYVDGSDDLDKLHEIVYDITALEAKSKVINEEVKTVYAKIPSLRKIHQHSNLTLDQIRTLEEHGISKEGVYGGIQNVKPKAEESDSYEVRVLTFDIAGYASLPSMKDFEAMLGGQKNINGPGEIMVQYHKELGAMVNLDSTPDTNVRDTLLEKQKEIKQQLHARRNQLNMIKMAKILTGDFFAGLVPDTDGLYSYVKNDKKMVVKNTRKLEYI